MQRSARSTWTGSIPSGARSTWKGRDRETCCRSTFSTSGPPATAGLANYPGSGLLPEDFPEPWLFVWDLTGDRAPYIGDISVPIEPMVGIVGCTPAAPGVHSSIPPLRTGGNMDVKHIGIGSTVYLPVEVEGALVGLGDHMRRRETGRSVARGSRPR